MFSLCLFIYFALILYTNIIHFLELNLRNYLIVNKNDKILDMKSVKSILIILYLDV